MTPGQPVPFVVVHNDGPARDHSRIEEIQPRLHGCVEIAIQVDESECRIEYRLCRVREVTGMEDRIAAVAQEMLARSPLQRGISKITFW